VQQVSLLIDYISSWYLYEFIMNNKLLKKLDLADTYQSTLHIEIFHACLFPWY